MLFFLLPGRIFGRAYSCWFRPNSMVSRWYHHGLCFAYFFGILTYYNKIQVKSDLDYHDNCKMYKSLINNKPYIHNVSNVFCEDIYGLFTHFHRPWNSSNHGWNDRLLKLKQITPEVFRIMIRDVLKGMWYRFQYIIYIRHSKSQ